MENERLILAELQHHVFLPWFNIYHFYTFPFLLLFLCNNNEFPFILFNIIIISNANGWILQYVKKGKLITFIHSGKFWTEYFWRNISLSYGNICTEYPGFLQIREVVQKNVHTKWIGGGQIPWPLKNVCFLLGGENAWNWIFLF